MRSATITQEVKLTPVNCLTYSRSVVAAAAMAFLFVMTSGAQNAVSTQPAATGKRSPTAQNTMRQATPAPSPETPFSRDLQKYPGLLPELAQLLQRIQQGVQPPEPRTASQLLPLLPDSTIAYGALPNYGGVAHQTLAIFRRELQESAVLRDWWAHGSPAASAPKIEQALEQFDQFQQYLGDEIVLSGSLDGEHKSGTFLALAEIRKPGLDKFLQQLIPHTADAPNSNIHVLTPDRLNSMPDPKPGAVQGFTILVRPDFVLAGTDIATLRRFNARLTSKESKFAASAFGQRVLQEYQGGANIVAAADVHKLLERFPIGGDSGSAKSKENAQAFQQSGFADMEYAVWKQTKANGQSTGEAELSFAGPRRGAAAWLGKPADLGSLNFVSPKAMMAFSLVLSSFPQVYDDIKALAGPPSPNNVFGAIEGGQKALNVSLKEDLLAQLAGEFTVEVDSLTEKQPAAKIIFKVNDAARLQKTLKTLLAAAQMPAEHLNDGRVAYDVIHVPNQGGQMPIAYAFVDGYWIIASQPEILLDAVQLHVSGNSLTQSQRFLAALPAGSAQPVKASGLFYQDPLATFGPQLRQASPEIAEFLAQFAKQDAPVSVSRLYGEETAIRAASRSGSVDIGSTMTALVVAALAIPNLMRSRMAANEASAVGSLRVLNVAQVTYAETYPKRGFAPNLAALGTGASGSTKYSEEHAGLVDYNLANESCTGDAWCNKSGYQFRISTGCNKLAPCKEYVAVAAPADANTGTRSFCTTSDGVIRYKIGAPSTVPLAVAQCRTWLPLK